MYFFNLTTTSVLRDNKGLAVNEVGDIIGRQSRNVPGKKKGKDHGEQACFEHSLAVFHISPFAYQDYIIKITSLFIER